MKQPVIHFGKKSYRIAFAQWDEGRSIGMIQVYDQDENAYIVESLGLASWEQRQAVAEFAMRKAIADRTAEKIAQSATP